MCSIAEGAKPHEGRQSRERQAAFVARQTLEAPSESGTVGSALGRRAGRARAPFMEPQGDGGESPGGANTQEGKVRRPVLGLSQACWCVVPLPGQCFRPNRSRGWRANTGLQASACIAGSAACRGCTNGKSSVVALVPPSGGAFERQERRGPERGAADRGEQGPEGRTPWMLRSRRASPGAAGRKSSRG
jgi:hypothetical protein